MCTGNAATSRQCPHWTFARIDRIQAARNTIWHWRTSPAPSLSWPSAWLYLPWHFSWKSLIICALNDGAISIRRQIHQLAMESIASINQFLLSIYLLIWLTEWYHCQVYFWITFDWIGLFERHIHLSTKPNLLIWEKYPLITELDCKTLIHQPWNKKRLQLK